MKTSEIRGKDSRELKLEMQSMRKELFELRFRAAAEEIANTARFQQLKKGIARLATVLREREIAEAKSAEAGN